MKKKSSKPRTLRGVTYWPTYESARAYARTHKLPTDRIIQYGAGWAIQAWKSGPYFDVTVFQFR